MFTFGLFSMHLPYIAFFAVTIFYMLTGSPFQKQAESHFESDQNIVRFDQDSSDQANDQSFHFQNYFLFDEIDYSHKYNSAPISTPCLWLDFGVEKLLDYSIFNRPPPSLL